MAVATVLVRTELTHGSSLRRKNTESLLVIPAPDKKEWIADHNIETLMLDGIWRMRRIIYTKEMLYIARPSTAIVLDAIPLHEIEDVMEMNDVVDKSPNVKVPNGKSFADWAVNNMYPDSNRNFTPKSNAHSTGLEESKSFLAEASLNNILQIKTCVGGINSGRTYYMSTRNCEDPENSRLLIVSQLKTISHLARRNAERKSRFQKSQEGVRRIHESMWFQSMVAILISANFGINAAEAQIVDQLTDESGGMTPMGQRLETLDTFFTLIFAAELSVNAYAHWFRPFIRDGWNGFDLLVVALSLVALGPVSMPINVLRSMRAFRVIRLFGRMGSLRDIVAALTAAIIPVLNAFLIMLIVASIYSVLGTTFFGSAYPDHFGRFDRLLATLFCLAGGLLGWMDLMPEEVAGDGQPNLNPVFLFVGSFVVVVNWTLLQISVAVLLDSFLTARAQKTQEKEAEELERLTARNTIHSALDPLLQVLSREYVDDKDLSNRLRKLFDLLDIDDSQGLDSKEFCSGIRKLDFQPPIHLSEEDFAVISNNGELLNESGQLGFLEFEVVMLNQIRLHVQRQLSNTLIAAGSRFEVAQLSAMKSLFHENSKLQEHQLRLSESVSYVLEDLARLGDSLHHLTLWARGEALPPSPRLADGADSRARSRRRRRRSAKAHVTSLPEIPPHSIAAEDLPSNSGDGSGGSDSTNLDKCGGARVRGRVDRSGPAVMRAVERDSHAPSTAEGCAMVEFIHSDSMSATVVARTKRLALPARKSAPAPAATGHDAPASAAPTGGFVACPTSRMRTAALPATVDARNGAAGEKIRPPPLLLAAKKTAVSWTGPDLGGRGVRESQEGGGVDEVGLGVAADCANRPGDCGQGCKTELKAQPQRSSLTALPTTTADATTFLPKLPLMRPPCLPSPSPLDLQTATRIWLNDGIDQGSAGYVVAKAASGLAPNRPREVAGVASVRSELEGPPLLLAAALKRAATFCPAEAAAARRSPSFSAAFRRSGASRETAAAAVAATTTVRGFPAP